MNETPSRGPEWNALRARGATRRLAPLAMALVIGFLAPEVLASPRLDAPARPPSLSRPAQPVFVAARRRRKRPPVAAPAATRKPRKTNGKGAATKDDAEGGDAEGGAAEEGGAAASGGEGGSAAAPPPSAGALQRGARVEFDGRLVQGQMAKSGAIYLFARKRSQLRSMVKERTEYRKEILRTVYPSYESN